MDVERRCRRPARSASPSCGVARDELLVGGGRVGAGRQRRPRVGVDLEEAWGGHELSSARLALSSWRSSSSRLLRAALRPCLGRRLPARSAASRRAPGDGVGDGRPATARRSRDRPSPRAIVTWRWPGPPTSGCCTEASTPVTASAAASDRPRPGRRPEHARQLAAAAAVDEDPGLRTRRRHRVQQDRADPAPP